MTNHSETDKKPICGFIGLGAMGLGMAKNIRANFYDLVVMGRKNRAPVDLLLKMGATEVKTPMMMAERCDVIILCVTGSSEVSDILSGKDGIFAARRRPDQLPLRIIDCSTSDPSVTKKLAVMAAQNGMILIDAPLGRTPREAEAGTLDMMLGCDASDLPVIEPILRCCAKNIFHLGPVGSGHTMKLVNNFIAMGQGALLADALALAIKGGISAAQFHQVIGNSRMSNGFYETFMGGVLAGDPTRHVFAIRNCAKDTNYVVNFAQSCGADSDLKHSVAGVYRMMVAAGQGESFLPSLADFVAAEQGIDPSKLRADVKKD